MGAKNFHRASIFSYTKLKFLDNCKRITEIDSNIETKKILAVIIFLIIYLRVNEV